eukprot:GHVS01019437.1.p1 GENE.GHVS01019437.1~~GHVS01019437.1.p1  ORF type:complete len:362 (+),score=64.32 GHVS01019437.1:299-1384(+)
MVRGTGGWGVLVLLLLLRTLWPRFLLNLPQQQVQQQAQELSSASSSSFFYANRSTDFGHQPNRPNSLFFLASSECRRGFPALPAPIPSYLPALLGVSAEKVGDVEGGEGGEEEGGKEEPEGVHGEEEDDVIVGDSDGEEFEGEFELKDEAKYAMLAEGFEYKYGENGKKKNWRKAVDRFQKAVNTGDAIAAQAYHELGDTFLYGGEGVRRDIRLAVQHFNSSAVLGFGPALHVMSFFYATGLDGIVERNDETSSRLEYLASMTNHLPSILSMGFRYLHGQGVEKDCELALKHYKFAAEVALRHDDGVPRAPLQDADRLTAGTRESWRQMQAAQDQKVTALLLLFVYRQMRELHDKGVRCCC